MIIGFFFLCYSRQRYKIFYSNLFRIGSYGKIIILKIKYFLYTRCSFQ
ncbi:hypothetical protein M124_2926 [Bacteroides fragilis str. 3988T(B)14]|uniref:Uncharacterized protein n=1 Tax=Bacteroides fragilis str. 3988T(B)14 TaxID=1339315 RepID=A0A015SSN2_BACFG|nr:hypothetical protein M124_2926 [Bacteroides fragilis str. 3988T(B)14]